MKRSFVLLALAAPLALGACSQPEVVTEAVLEQEGEVVQLAELPVRFLPYDRDAIFDSLEAAAAEPEPQLPPDLVELQQQIAAAQERWTTAEARWGVVRDSLRELSERLQGMPRTSPQYNALFREFGRLEEEERRVNQIQQQAFQQFTQIQQQFLTRADSVRIAREEWADRAFEDYDQVVAARLEALGLEEVADTTNAAGIAVVNLPEGQWWAYSRYTLPYEELYWNVPFEVAGDSTHVMLNRETATVRPVF